MEFKNKEPRKLFQDKAAGATNLEDRDQLPAFASETLGSNWRGHVGWTKPVQRDTGQTLPNENKGLFLILISYFK